MPFIERCPDAVLVGKVPIAGTAAQFAIRLDPDADGRGASIHCGFLQADGKSLVLCHSTGAGQPPLELIALLRAAVDSLEDQAKAARVPGSVRVRDYLYGPEDG